MGQLLRTRGTKAKSHIHAINNLLTSNVVLSLNKKISNHGIDV